MLPASYDIHYFLEVSSTLNVSRAAERLGISQPTLSASLKRLEAGVGAALLVRTKSGVQLTQAGRIFARSAQSLVSNWDALRNSVSRHTSGLVGRFKLGCHTSVGQFVLPRFLPRLFEENPQIEISLEHDLSRKITEQVISHSLDFGLVVNPVRHPDLVLVELYKNLFTFWKSKKRTGDTIICDLSLQQVQLLLKKFQKRHPEFRRILTSQSLDIVCQLVQEGVGVGILPEAVAMRSTPPLVRIPRTESVQDSAYLIYRADMQTSQAAKVIIQSIKKARYS